MDFTKKVFLKFAGPLFFLYFILFPFGQLLRFGTEAVTLNLIDVIVCLISGLFLFFFFTQKNVETEEFTKPLLCFLGICAFTLLLGSLRISSVDTLDGTLYLLRFSAYFGLYFAGQIYFKDRSLVNYLFVVGLFIFLFGVVQYILFPDLRSLAIYGWDEHYYRLAGTFLDPGFTGILLSLWVLLCLNKTIDKNKTYFFFAILGALAVMLTYSRASYLALIAGVLIISYLRRSVLLPAILILVFVFSVVFISKPQGEGGNLTRSSTIDARFLNYTNAQKIIIENPLFGIGFNLYRAYGIANGHASRSVDSSLLFVTATTGVAGLATLLYLLLEIVKASLRNHNFIFVASLGAVLIHSIFQNSFFYSFVLGWLLLILARGETRESS